MIFIVGGRGQGQNEYARTCISEKCVTHGEMRIADGESDAPECALDADLVLNLHLFVKKVMEREENPGDFIAELLRTEPEIITMDEIGCGIVPLDAFDRRYRDEAGMAGQMTALRAECVIRMICGIPRKIR